MTQSGEFAPTSLLLSASEEIILAALYKLECLHGYAMSTASIARQAQVTPAEVLSSAQSLVGKGLVRSVVELGAECHWEIDVKRPDWNRGHRWYGSMMLALSRIAEKHQARVGWIRPMTRRDLESEESR